MSIEHASDPLFWPLLFVALLVGLFVLTIMRVVSVLARRHPEHHPQHALGRGTNLNDSSSHNTTSITVGKILMKGRP